MADEPTTPPTLPDAEYPTYVVTDEERARWDAARGVAELIFGDLPDQVWQATRAIYGSDVPT